MLYGALLKQPFEVHIRINIHIMYTQVHIYIHIHIYMYIYKYVYVYLHSSEITREYYTQTHTQPTKTKTVKARERTKDEGKDENTNANTNKYTCWYPNSYEAKETKTVWREASRHVYMCVCVSGFFISHLFTHMYVYACMCMCMCYTIRHSALPLIYVRFHYLLSPQSLMHSRIETCAYICVFVCMYVWSIYIRSKQAHTYIPMHIHTHTYICIMQNLFCMSTMYVYVYPYMCRQWVSEGNGSNITEHSPLLWGQSYLR